MSTNIIPWLYFSMSIFGLTAGLYLRGRFSGPKIRAYPVILCLIFSLAFFAINYTIVFDLCFPFYTCVPDMHERYPVIAWTAFICMLSQGLTLPVEWEPKKWFTKK